jgi:RNA polymerase sigma-70 factor (sigma-E family)
MAVRREQDVAAFSEFVAGRSGSLFRTALLVVGDHQLAQDLVQESLVKTYVAWSRLRDVSNADAYTRRVIVTTSISWWRRRSSRERPVEQVPDVGITDRADRPDLDDELWVALRSLPPRQRAAVALRFCEDLSEVRTAELMGCSVGSVKRHTSMGLAKLRAQIGPSVSLPGNPPPDEPAVIA